MRPHWFPFWWALCLIDLSTIKREAEGRVKQKRKWNINEMTNAMRSPSQLALRDEHSPPNLTHRAHCRAHLPNILASGTNMGQENIGVVFMCSLYHHGLIERGPGNQSSFTSRKLWWTCIECLQDATSYWQPFWCDRLSWHQKPWRPPYVWWKIRIRSFRWIEEPSRFLTVFPILWWWWALWACTAQENHIWWTAWLDRTMVRVVWDNSQLLELLTA